MEEESQWPCDGRGIVGNIKCGDQMLILLRIKDDVIEDVRWKTYGCASAIASSSALTELVKGMTLECEELENAQPKYDQARFNGFTEEELIQYSVLSEKIKQNVKNILV